jgi:hypothetical protein
VKRLFKGEAYRLTGYGIAYLTTENAKRNFLRIKKPQKLTKDFNRYPLRTFAVKKYRNLYDQ